MLRLLVHVEGQTEETFVNEVLCSHLLCSGYSSVSARRLGNPRQQRGGIRPWQGAKRDILRHLKSDHEAINTTMVDYYALPQDWPGRAEAPDKHSSSAKAEHVEEALLANIAEEMGPHFNPRRFLPMVVMHEFEALLFSDPNRFARGICRGNLAAKLSAIRRGFATPEEINDSPETAPSKRIMHLFPGYEKPLYGAVAAMEIGLPKIRQQCPHFNGWLNRLEALPQEIPSHA
jgi:hypothetical protein